MKNGGLYYLRFLNSENIWSDEYKCFHFDNRLYFTNVYPEYTFDDMFKKYQLLLLRSEENDRFHLISSNELRKFKSVFSTGEHLKEIHFTGLYESLSFKDNSIPSLKILQEQLMSDGINTIKMGYYTLPQQERIQKTDNPKKTAEINTIIPDKNTVPGCNFNNLITSDSQGIRLKSVCIFEFRGNVSEHYTIDYIAALFLIDSKRRNPKLNYDNFIKPAKILREKNDMILEKINIYCDVLMPLALANRIQAMKSTIECVSSSDDKYIKNIIHFYSKYLFYSQGNKKRILIDRLYLLFKCISCIRNSDYIKDAVVLYHNKDDNLAIFKDDKINGKACSETQSIKGIIMLNFPDASPTELNKIIGIRNKVLKANELSNQDIEFLMGSSYTKKELVDNTERIIYGTTHGYLVSLETIINDIVIPG